MIWLFGELPMRRQKRKSGIWHHRAPDFKLVYCGPEEGFPEKETKELTIRKEVSETENKHDSNPSRLLQKQKID